MRRCSHLLFIFCLFFFIFYLSFFVNSSFLFAGTIEWQASNAGGGEALYSDSGHTTKLAEGCLVQLILDVDGNGLNPIENSGSIEPAGSNILMPLTSGDNTGSIGANVPFDKEGRFQYTVGFDTTAYAGKTVYVRFWNSSSPSAGSAYGESTGYTLTDTSLPQVFNIAASGSLYTNKTLGSGASDTTTSLTIKVYDADTNITISAPLIKLYNSSGTLISSTTSNPCAFTVSKNSSYYIRVEKQGYIFPSDKASACVTGDHGELFTMGNSDKEINIPIDRGNVITVEYTVNKKQVNLGDIVTFNIELQNNSSLSQDDIIVKATKMSAFKYIDGSAYLDNQKINPAENSGKYDFSVNSISGNGTANILYQTIVSTGASKGEYKSIVVSYRQSSNDQVSNSDEVKVLVTEDPLMDRGTIIGKIFIDANCNGVQDGPLTPPSPRRGEDKQSSTRSAAKWYVRSTGAGTRPSLWGEGVNESGIPGVRIVTEYGVIVETDSDGKYHIPDVPAGRHILKVMEDSLPSNNMIILENPRWINTTEGILNKVNFSVIKREIKKPEEKKEFAQPLRAEAGFAKKETKTAKKDKKEKIIERRVEETGPEGKYIREEKYELIEKEIEEVGPDGKIIKKRIKGYVKTEFVGEVEVIEERPIELKPPPEVVIVKEEVKPEIEEKPEIKVAKEKPALTKILKIFKDTFIVAYAEGTLRNNVVSGNEDFLKDMDKSLKEGWRGDGRLAFTLLTKLLNKINLIASLDTDRIKTAASKMLAGNKIMTNLDEDKYYPTYGDSSQIDYTAADTQDLVYAKAQCGESEAVWGGYKTQMPLYQKAFQGGNIKYRSEGKTRFDEHKTELDTFYAKDHNTQAHDEFVATGGSLYYLKNREIIEGSEQLRILIKDRLTDRVLKEMPLREEYDYTIDYTTGRVLLRNPLSSISYFNMDSVVSNDLLAGNQVVLSTDYTYWTDEMKRSAYGGRIKQNITDYVSVEGMYVNEDKAVDPYKLYGGKATLRINPDTFISARYSKSEETVLASGLSYDGGFNYVINNANWSDNKNGDEIDVTAQSTLFNRIQMQAGYTDTDSYFNTTESLTRSGRKLLYANFISPLTDAIKTGIKYNRQKAKEDSFNTEITGNTDFDITSGFVSYVKGKLDTLLEIQHQAVYGKIIEAYDYMGTIPLRDNDFIASKIGYKINEKLYSYIRGQGTIQGRANNQATVGAEYKIIKDYSVRLAETIGNLGNSTILGLNRVTGDGISSYTTMELGDYIDLGKYIKTTTGQSAPVNKNAKVYYETDYSSFRERLLQGKVLGYEQELIPGLLIGTNYERSHYNKLDDLVNRDSGAVTVTYLNPDIFRFSGKVEIRDDKLTEIRNRQWVTSNYLHWYFTKDLSFLGKFAWSETRNIKLKNTEARFYDIGAGVAYRPIKFDRLNILAKYNYITDLPPGEQTISQLVTDSKKHVIGVEGSFDVCRYLELVGKCAYRMQGDEVGPLVQDSDTLLYIGRVNVHITKKWDICGEYRALNNNQIDAKKSGFLFELQRSVLGNVQIGAGYNFTDFNDDLTNSDEYDSSGWFVRVSGKY